MKCKRPDPDSAALPAPQSLLGLVAFDACDCEVPAAVRLVGEALADAARPPGGGLPRPPGEWLATAGAGADATRCGEPGTGSIEPALAHCIGADSESSDGTLFCPSILVMGSLPLLWETLTALLRLSLLFSAFSLATLDIQMSAKNVVKHL